MTKKRIDHLKSLRIHNVRVVCFLFFTLFSVQTQHRLKQEKTPSSRADVLRLKLCSTLFSQIQLSLAFFCLLGRQSILSQLCFVRFISGKHKAVSIISTSAFRYCFTLPVGARQHHFSLSNVANRVHSTLLYCLYEQRLCAQRSHERVCRWIGIR